MKEYQKMFLETAKKLKKGTVAVAILGRQTRKKNIYLLVQGKEYRVDLLRCRDRRDVRRITSKLQSK
jgi:hypothetical protein